MSVFSAADRSQDPAYVRRIEIFIQRAFCRNPFLFLPSTFGPPPRHLICYYVRERDVQSAINNSMSVETQKTE